MNIRKMKKEIKKSTDVKFKRQGLLSLKLIRKWANSDSTNRKIYMKILTHNFYLNGEVC